MPNIANKYKLGIFVVSTFCLLCIVLFLIGSFEFLKPKTKCMTVVTSSVQGLSVGAKVKYNGVAIGQVTDIKISPRGDYVFIYMSLSSESFDSDDILGYKAVSTFSKFLNDSIDKGLRCQLNYEGITGTLYQEIKFFNPKEFPVEKITLPANHPLYIPSASPILMGSIMMKINSSLEKLSNLDKIFAEVSGTLETINSYLKGKKFSGLIDHVDQISNNIRAVTSRFNETLTKERIEKIVNETEEIMSEIKLLSKNANKEIFEAKIPQTASDARNMMQVLVKELGEAVKKFNTAAESINELSNTINNQPDSVIWGKEERKVIPSF